MEVNSAHWSPIELDPEVIAEYVTALGGPENVYFHDIYSLELEELYKIPTPVYAVLLVYPITAQSIAFQEEFENSITSSEPDLEKIAILEDVWFTRQLVTNACGTVALLHTFANMKLPCKSDGMLQSFISKCRNLSPDERGAALGSEPRISEAHKKAAVSGVSLLTDTDDHYVAFVNINNFVVELDGRKKGPIVHQKLSSTDMFLPSAVNIIEKNYFSADPTQMKFSLLAVSGHPA